MNFLSNLLMGNRRSGVLGLFDRRRRGGIVNGVNNNRAASALGTLAMIATPIMIRRAMARRQQGA